MLHNLINSLTNTTKRKMFVFEGKVALISGGASGLGLSYAKELLRNGLRGVTIADVNEKFEKTALNEINEEFGANRAIFVKTDVTDREQFEEAFKTTIATFKNLDILINNAGLVNEKLWEKTVTVNINGTINGVLLALESYFKYRSGPEAVIVNISSIAGVISSSAIPIYSGTKHAIAGMTRAWGAKSHYERTQVKVLALCPGLTDTPMATDLTLGENLLGPQYKPVMQHIINRLTLQPPEFVAKAMVKLIKEGETGSLWVVENKLPPYEVLNTINTKSVL